MKKALLRRTFFQIRWEPLGYHHTWVETGIGIPAGERLHPAWALLLSNTKCSHPKQTRTETTGCV